MENAITTVDFGRSGDFAIFKIMISLAIRLKIAIIIVWDISLNYRFSVYAVIASMTPGRIHSIPEEANGDEGSQHVMVAEGESGKLL